MCICRGGVSGYRLWVGVRIKYREKEDIFVFEKY